MKIAVVIGASGGWLWHKRLAEKLSAFGTVEVRAVEAPGEALVRAWIAVEQRLFHVGGGATPVSAEALGARSLGGDVSQFDVVIDLSGVLERATLTLKYDGQAGEGALIGRLLRREQPVMTVETADGATLASSYPAIEDREVLARALGYIFARAAALVERAVARLNEARAIAPLDLLPARSVATASVFGLVGFVAGSLVRKVAGKLAGKKRLRQAWLTALRAAQPPEGVLPSCAPITPVVLADGCECADPFLFAHEGRTWLFAEKIKRDGRGVLAFAEVGEGGAVGAFTEFMDGGDHMSYPFVFAHDGQIWLLPETGARKSLTLFRAEAFPEKWVPEATLLSGQTIADATLFRHDGRWWMLAVMAEGDASTHDELYAFYSDALTGPWTAHAANPLKSDARSSRPAGKVIEREGRLLRPAQNCERYYGAGLAWCEIVLLTPERFEERVLAQWEAASFGAYVGVHTYNEGGGFEAVDLLEMRPRG